MTNIAFIVGVARSGTSILGELIASHPDVRYLFEGHELWEAVDIPGRGDSHRLTADHASSKVIKGVRTVMKSNMKSAFLVEKNPRNVLRIPFLHKILPEAKIVHIVRDGRDVACSLLPGIGGDPWEHLKPPSWKRFAEEKGIVRCAYVWKECMEIALHDLSRVPHLQIRYEDLVANPREMAVRVMDYLGLSHHPAVLDFCTKIQNETSQSYQAKHQDEWCRDNHQQRVGRWLENLSAQEQKDVEQIIGPLLETLGYQNSQFTPVSADPVCVAGMHRSGTSMVTQLLAKCGLYLGRQENILGPASDNQDGFWENVLFVKLNEEILTRLGGAWDMPPQLAKGWEFRPEIETLLAPARKLIDSFKGSEPWGWKDPRNSITAPFWERVIGTGTARYILCVRHPLEVAQSIQKRNGNSLAFGFNLWYAYNKTMIENTSPGKRIITHYDSYFSDPEAELRRIMEFLGMKIDGDAIRRSCARISRKLRHHNFDRNSITKEGAPKQMIDLYEELCGHSGPVLNRITSCGPAASGLQSPVRSQVQPGQALPRPEAPPLRKPLVSIIILTYNQLKVTQECIDSIRQFTPESHEIVFVDNGSTDGTVPWLRKLVEQNPGYCIIENPTNMGFARGCNQGIAAASGEHLLLLNNDVVVTAEWLSGLLECLRSEPTSGIVGPMTNNISGTQKDPDAAYKTIKEMHRYARAFRENNRHRKIPLRRIVGFCMLFRRELVDKIGLLDESFGTGNFEDDDFCLRAALEGFRNVIAGDVFIHHYGSRTFIGNKIDYAATLGGHKQVFSSKWSKIKRDTELGRRLLMLGTLEKVGELQDKGEIEEAVGTCIEGIGLFPDQPEIYNLLAKILLEEKRYQEALDALAAMPESCKEDPDLLLSSGYCKEGLHLDDEAESYADKVLVSAPDNAVATNLKGVLAYKRGDLGTAEDFFRKAIERSPGYGEPHTNLGVMKWAEGDKEGGLLLLERGFILSPKVMDIATLYHSAASEMQEFERAERVFREAKALHPLNQRIGFLLIDLLLRQGKEYAAMQAIEEALTTFALSDGLLQAALAVRNKIGPAKIKEGNRKSLSVSMIVKNEEKHVAKCLMSVKPIADEMVVVDTGSTDRTKDIARALGATVYDFSWDGDFSAARNYSLSKAAGGWILSLDADEVISSSDYRAVREIVEKGKSAAYKITTRNYSTQVGSQGFIANSGEYPTEEAGLGWFPSAKVRIFPNHKGIRFENPVHEFVEGSAAKAGITIMPSNIPVHHYGRLDEGKLREKGEAYYLLGKKKLQEKGNTDLKALFELGVQAGELKKYDEAAVLFERLVTLSPLYPLAQFNLGFAYMELGRFMEALPYAKMGYELNPEKKECALNYAHCEIVVGDMSHAVALLNDMQQREPDYPPALALLSAAYAISGNQDSQRILKALEARRFDCSNFLHEFAEALTHSGRYEQAMRIFELIVKSGNAREDTKELLDRCYRTGSGQDDRQTSSDCLKGLNPYDRQLTAKEIDAKVHRRFVGGMWEELGELQFTFMKQQGLKPQHHLIDVGCGALRGGIHFIKYLDKGHYFGIDLNASIIEAGRRELHHAGIADREPHLLVTNAFEMSTFHVHFDFGIAVSVFTHLPMNHIILCLSEMRKVLTPEGVFFATFFQAPESAYTGSITHDPGGVVTKYDADPFHYSFEEFCFMAQIAGMEVSQVNTWKHPRNQRMLAFRVVA